MNITIKRAKFKDIFESAMLKKTGVMIDPASFLFSDASASVSLMSADIMGVGMTLKPGFFEKYSVEKDEVLTISEELLKTILSGFKEDEITISTDEKKIKFKSTRDNYEIEQEYENRKHLPWKLKKFKDYGLIPEKMNPESAVIIQANEFDFPSGLDYSTSMKGR